VAESNGGFLRCVFREAGFHLPRIARQAQTCPTSRARRRAHGALWLLATVGLLTAPPAVGQVPGPEIFHKDIKDPMELWDAADYLVRTGQAKHAVPFLEKFLKSNPSDETLIAIRDRYGVRSILNLEDHPETRHLAEQVANMLAAAARRNATDPDRIAKFVSALTKSPHEQEYAVERLKEAGPYAVPFLIQELDRPALEPDERAMIVRNIGRLDRAVVPPLIAALDSADTKLVTDVAQALGAIGDRRALSQLTFRAARTEPGSQLGMTIRHAIQALTGRPFESQPISPVHLLTEEARRYHVHAVRFPSDPVLIWDWDAVRKVPVPRQVSQSAAEEMFGLRLAREALVLDPANLKAQAVLVSIALDKAIERTGFGAFPQNDPAGSFAAALSAGPTVLADVLQTAIADRKYDLAAVAASAFGQVTDVTPLPDGRRLNPLIAALSAPSRRVQFAAARALVQLDPHKPFAGSSRVVPILAWFVTNQPSPRAVIIDGNASRGSQMSGQLKALGYEPMLAPTGDEGFRIAAESADVELVMIDPHMIQGPWRLTDTLANLRADARTAGIPLYVYGPLNFDVKLDYLKTSFPGVKFVVFSKETKLLEQQLGGRPSLLSAGERSAYAREAATLLARVATEPGSPFEYDVVSAEPALVVALNTPGTSLAAATALGDVPGINAQRGLADVLLDPSKPVDLRISSAVELAKSVQRFGRLVSDTQETRLLTAFDGERDLGLRTAQAAVIGALRPKAGPIGVRLQQYQPLPPQPVPASRNPESATSPPTPAEPPATEKPAAPQDGANP
jgi:HEAT repeat protein